MTTVPASVEVSDDGAIAFAFDYPGACGWGPSEAEALDGLRADVVGTCEWLADHGLVGPPETVAPGQFDVEVTERVPATGDPPACDSEGFFAVDARPYDGDDLARTRELLAASRGDLLDATADLDPETLDVRLVEGRRTVREVLDHVAVAEHWYVTRVEAPSGPRADWRAYPPGPFERLDAARADVERFLASLGDVPAADRAATRTVDGERWSASKVLRRLVWHERLHCEQLRGLVPKAVAATG